MNFGAGATGEGAMRVVVWLAVCVALTATQAHAEDDMAAMTP
jgi:hypothetical protein